jgi:DoxX-like family
MTTAYFAITLAAAAFVGFSAASAFAKAKWVVQPLTDYGIPQAWLPWLATAKAAGAVGLIVGLFVPPIGLIAALGLILYFTGAVITVIRARWYSHIAYPLLYVAPVIAALALGFIAG